MRIGHIENSKAAAKDRRKATAPEAPAMGRRERRAAETRLKLFRTALELFIDRGFQNVTVEDITEGADVGKGTFFNYFESKEHVLGVMTELQMAHVREAVQAAASGKSSIHSTMHHLFLGLTKEPGQSPDFARTVIGSFLASAVVRGLIERQMSEGRRMIAVVIAEGQKRGEINPKLKIEDIALEMQQILLGTVLLWSLHGEPELKRWVEGSFRLFWRAIATKSSERKS
jgi:AcrR family transcriptional regulator